MSKIYSYLRVSTDMQDIEGQRLEITSYTKKLGILIDDTIELEISSRKSLEQRQIDKLLSTLKKNDVLIVSELSRLGRSSRELHNILYELEKKSITFHCIKQNIVIETWDDMTSKMILTVFGMMAEVERNMISQRVKHGMALARSRGKRIGNPNLPTINKNRKANADKFALKLKPILEGLIHSGKSYPQIALCLNESGIKTRRGCEFKPMTVKRLVDRLEI